MIVSRFGEALRETVKPALDTIKFLLLLMIPVSLGVMLLDKSGILPWLARFAAPLMGFLGLPGEAALACLSAIFLNIYSAIAVMETLSLSGRDIIILTTFVLIAHNFIVESAVLKKSGSSASRMILIRLIYGFAAAWVINRILPPAPLTHTEAILPAIGLDVRELPSLLLIWLGSSGILIIRIAIIIFAVIFLQKLLDNRLLRFISAISYNLYIWHQVLAVQMRQAFFPDADAFRQSLPQQWAFTLLCYSVAILAAMLATFGVEQPIARLTQKISSNRRKRQHEGSQVANA